MKNFLGEKIRQYRVENGLTQRQFADRCDLDEFYISRIENGKRTPGRKALVQIANAMQISVDSLLRTLLFKMNTHALCRNLSIAPQSFLPRTRNIFWIH